ncbi:hypothetical protein BDP55DRAFT_310623 [Colletotrichum godetiae]|uniref:Uncharacterized protein n=1 Tax=Colletotrichum godetiae TaxID=1209918 RepID=A0AAJ0F2U1_9PEZI|nr:uncharacterized protein BDP55DRAFT_310623 [Colletotrichum godetiae]KAK1690837.1 hypothetical protein BDP55DRAFT_310623 [Colletotrichum godetiae]
MRVVTSFVNKAARSLDILSHHKSSPTRGGITRTAGCACSQCLRNEGFDENSRTLDAGCIGLGERIAGAEGGAPAELPFGGLPHTFVLLLPRRSLPSAAERGGGNVSSRTMIRTYVPQCRTSPLWQADQQTGHTKNVQWHAIPFCPFLFSGRLLTYPMQSFRQSYPDHVGSTRAGVIESEGQLGVFVLPVYLTITHFPLDRRRETIAEMTEGRRSFSVRPSDMPSNTNIPSVFRPMYLLLLLQLCQQ